MTKEDLVLFNELAGMLLQEERRSPVVMPIDPKELFDRLDLSLGEKAASREIFEKVLKDLIIHTPKTSSSRFFNQLFGGRTGHAIVGDLLAVLLNNSMYTYKVAGPMVGVEKEVLQSVANIIGYPSEAGGTIASGGSLTNLMAMLMARNAVDLDMRNTGVSGKLTIYTSAESHYSIPKNASFIGVGKNQVRFIETDDQGRMLASVLETQIKKDIANDFIPFFVNVTAGTTVLGAFDSIQEIQPVCNKYKVWLHVDGAYCGAVIFSNKYRHLVEGLSETNSFSFNAHKMLNTTLTCSIILTRDKKHLYDSFAVEADYLYQTDADEYNLGKTSLQCGRRNDALKVWSLWKAIGTAGLGDMVDNQFYLADVARAYIESNPDYTLYSFENSVSICFNYKNIAPKDLCSGLYEHGQLMVGYGSFQNETFVRLVTINAGNSKEEIIEFFRVLEEFADSQFS